MISLYFPAHNIIWNLQKSEYLMLPQIQEKNVDLEDLWLTRSTYVKWHKVQSSREGNPMCLKLRQNHIDQSIFMAIFQPQCMYCHLWE